MNLQLPTIQFKEYGTYADAYTLVYIKNPNTSGSVHYDITITDISENVVLDTISADVEVNSGGGTSYAIYPALYFDSAAYVVTVQAYAYIIDTLSDVTVAELCESTKDRRFSGTSAFQKKLHFAYLKAFCNMPGESFEDVYMYWEHSSDGVSWEPYDLIETDNIDPVLVQSLKCSVFDHTYRPDGSLVEDEGVYVLRTVWKLSPSSCTDYFKTRPDLIRIPKGSLVDNSLYRVKMLTVKTVSGGDSEYVSEVTHTEKTILGTAIYTPVFSQQPELLVSDISNVSKSKSLYYGTTLYAFGNPEFKNYLVASLSGETVRPLSRLTPLETSENAYVTSLVPWKNYIVAFTEKTIHLVSVVDEGFTATTINTFIGIPEQDAACCTPTLNGIIFKANSKLYMLYPNIYAGADSVLNITEISSPIESYLEEYTPSASLLPFAIGTDVSYILMLPYSDHTVCIRYYYTDHKWTVYEYPIVVESYEMLTVSDIRLFGYSFIDGTKHYGEYLFDVDYDLIFDNFPKTVPYADCLRHVSDFKNWQELLNSNTLKPISFELDSGQKTDSLNHNKQFVESKFNVVTLHEKDSFPMKITVYIDGCPFVTTRDVNTDSAFWKQNASHLGTLSTNFTSDNSDIFNVFRQMFIRYSGKGKSIRHIIEGESLYPFKIYEIDYRYRNLNVKQ